MALISCAECGKEMSTQAAACPHCGMQVPKASVWPKVLAIVIAVPITIILLVAVFGESNIDREARYQAARQECLKASAESFVSGPINRGGEVAAMRKLKACMSSRGFDAEVAHLP